MEIEPVEVCSQCLYVHANGCENEGDRHHELCLSEYEEDNGCTLALGGEELGFRHYLCEVCGELPGNRFQLNALYK